MTPITEKGAEIDYNGSIVQALERMDDTPVPTATADTEAPAAAVAATELVKTIKAARRVSTPLVAIQTADPAAAMLTSSTPIADRVFLLDLSIRSLGTAKKAPVGLITTDAQPDRVRLGKRILSCDEIAAIKGHLQQTRRYIEALMIPTGDQFRSGMYLMPFTLIERVEEYLKAAQTNLTTLVDRLLAVYDQRIADDRTALQSLFDQRNYPDREAVRKAFEIDYKYVCLATPEGLQRFSPEVYEREVAKLRARIEEAAEDSITLLAEEAKKLAASVIDRLTPGEDGKEKIFRDSLIRNWEEFLATFRDRNITGDAGLQELMATAEAKIKGRNPDDIRKSAEVREDIRTAFEQVTGQLDAMIVAKPVRKISFTDDDE